jgi:ribose-phosphate pyrophosphokinase
MSVYIKGRDSSITKFPAGESKVVVHPNDSFLNHYVIVMDFESNEDLINIAFMRDAIERSAQNDARTPIISLEVNYLPYARQDRVCNEGESHSLRVICDYINSLKFKSVLCSDLHSDVASALLNNLVHQDLTYCATRSIPAEVFKSAILVSPDVGSMKKVLKLGKQVDCKVEVATKERDCMTGAITNTIYSGSHIGNQDFIIVDDICEGGWTFTELAKILKNYTEGNIYLYVTHGIFSKGYKVFDNLIDGIYTYNLMGKDDILILNNKGE